MVTFIATDGTQFSSREEYRAYEMETQYTFRNRKGEHLTKQPGSTQGQPFDIADCSGCTIEVLDYTDMVQIDNATDSKIFVAASGESVFVRDCKNTTFTLACKQLRTRDCVNCRFYLYSKTEPIIETSSGMEFAPFNGAFKGHAEAMRNANLQPDHNLWFAVYDFNDEAKTGKNWRLLDRSEEGEEWHPIGKFKNCCPYVAPGSIALPSQGADPTDPNNKGKPTAQSGGMMSFSMNTSLHEAAKITGDAYVAQETAATSKQAPKKTSPKKKKSGVGWNPDASSSPEPAKAKPQKKTGVGWNPDAFSEPSPEPAKKPSPKKKSGVGWNPDAFSEPSPPKKKAARVGIGWDPSALEGDDNDDEDIPIRCDNPTEIRKRTTSDSITGRSRTDSDVTSATQGEKGVTLEMQALLMFAVERGIDLVKWFTPDDEKEAPLAFTVVSGKKDLLLTKDAFSGKLIGLGLGLGAGQDQETQEQIAAAISKGSVDTCSRKRNCDSGSPHPINGSDRISLRAIFEVSKIETSLTSTATTTAAAAAPSSSSVDTAQTAMAARRGVSPPKRQPPPPVSPARIKPAPTPPIKTKPLWSPSASQNAKKQEAFEVPLETPELDLEREIESCLQALCRQADSYHKLRSKLGLVGREDVEIKASEITKALSTLGLKLGPAGITALMRRASATPGDAPTPAALSSSVLRDYLLKLKLSRRDGKNPLSLADWNAAKKQQEAIEQTKRQREFQKALAGNYFELDEEFFDSMIESFEIVSSEVMTREIHARGVDWLGSNEGIRISRRKAMAEELKRGERLIDDDDKTEILHSAKLAALAEKKVLLAEDEKKSQETSKWLFRLYITSNRRKGFQDCAKFVDWCRKREDNRQAIREARKEWIEEKDGKAKKRAEAGSKVATVADVEELVKDLVAAATVETKNSGGVSVIKPSRQGLELSKKLHALEKLSGDGKIVSKCTFDEVMHDLIFSLLADKKTSKQARSLVTGFLKDAAAGGSASGIFTEDEGGKVAERALKIFKEKKALADDTFKSWCKKKKRQQKEAKKAKKADLKKKKEEKKAKAVKAEEAFTEWLALHERKQYYSFKRKEQVAVPKRIKKTGLKEWKNVPLDADGNPVEDGSENVNDSNVALE